MPRKKPAPLADGFQFVASNGPKATKVDPATRTLIRRQAMKDVANERKANAGRKAVHLSSPERSDVIDLERADGLPELVSANSTASSSSGLSLISDEVEEMLRIYDGEYFQEEAPFNADASSLICTTNANNSPRLWYALSNGTAYESARSRFGIDITLLGLLTSFSVAKTTIGQLAEDPGRMCPLISETSNATDSSFALVPQRYGSSALLAATTDCLLAKAAQVLMPWCSNEAEVSMFYARALRALQDAITDSVDASHMTDLLCAVQVITLHELLDPSREAAWAQHVSGSIRLWKYRGPKSFRNGFDKLVFQSHVGPVVSEALHNNNHCYLADPKWTALYESLTESTEYLTERHKLVIGARKLIFPTPGLWRDMGSTLRENAVVDDQTLAGLRSRAYALHTAYKIWLESYNNHCVARSFSIPTEQEVNLRSEVLGQALETLLIVDLLLATVSDCASDVVSDIAELSGRVLDLQHQPAPKYSWIFTAQEIGVAQVALATKGLFSEDLGQCEPTERTSAMRKRYMAWSGMLRGC